MPMRKHVLVLVFLLKAFYKFEAAPGATKVDNPYSSQVIKTGEVFEKSKGL